MDTVGFHCCTKVVCELSHKTFQSLLIFHRAIYPSNRLDWEKGYCLTSFIVDIPKILSIFQYAGPDIRWVDGQKSLFHVNLELVSTVTACDQHLHNFFTHMARLNETRSLASLFPSVVESESHKPTEVSVLQIFILYLVISHACNN